MLKEGRKKEGWKYNFDPNREKYVKCRNLKCRDHFAVCFPTSFAPTVFTLDFLFSLPLSSHAFSVEALFLLLLRPRKRERRKKKRRTRGEGKKRAPNFILKPRVRVFLSSSSAFIKAFPMNHSNAYLGLLRFVTVNSLSLSLFRRSNLVIIM